MQPSEVWKSVVGHVGYEVSDLGQVRSFRSPGKTPGLASDGRLLHPTFSKTGYPYLTLAEPRRKRYVHEMVAEAFIGPRPDGMVIAHGDGNPSNNRPANLRYTTQFDNSMDRNLHGTMLRGEQVMLHRLSDEDVLAIRTLYAAGGCSQNDLATRFEISGAIINRVVRGTAWAHLGGPRTYAMKPPG